MAVRLLFILLGSISIAAKYVLAQTSTPNIPPTEEVLLTFVIYLLSGIGGFLSMYYSSSWEVGVVLEIIAAIVAWFTSTTGTSVPTAAKTTPTTTTK